MLQKEVILNVKNTKKYIFLVCVALLTIASIILNRSKSVPQDTVENVLDKMAETSLIRYKDLDFENYNKTVQKNFQKYFTEEGYEESLAHRYFVCFYNDELSVDKIIIDEVNLEYTVQKQDDVTFIGDFKVMYFMDDQIKLTENWIINVRLRNDAGKWLVQKMKLKR